VAHSDSQTPVTLVVSPTQTTPAPAPHHHLPFTGFALVPLLLVAAVLVAIGTALTALPRPALLARTSPR
jgi:hypothetical protein